MPAFMTKSKNALLIAVGLLLLSNLLLLMQRAPAQAQDAGGLAAQVKALTDRLSADEATIAGLKAKTAPLSVAGRDLTVTGVNVHIVSGSGSTSDGVADRDNNRIEGKSLSGLGNLTIGYNEERGAGDARTGSHNLIVGTHNNYKSYGGLVAGDSDVVSASYASVSGGYRNTASADSSAVSGGDENTAGEFCASVSGGHENVASGQHSSVSGGDENIASGDWASISGGEANTAGGAVASAGGGARNKSAANYASVAGGSGNTASGFFAAVGGGRGLTLGAPYGWAAGAPAVKAAPARRER